MEQGIKLIVAIRSPLNMADRREAIRKTWGKAFLDHGADVFFVVSGDPKITTPQLVENDLLYTPGLDIHGDLTNRMCWLFRYLSDIKFTHVLIMDDDCSVNVPFFMTLPWRDCDAWGHNSGGYLSGSAAVFSKDTIKKLRGDMPRDDLVIGALLTRLNIKMQHAGNPCPIKPWRPSGKSTWSFGDSGIAIQHYVRSPQEITENHSKIKDTAPDDFNQRLKLHVQSEKLKDIEFIEVKASPTEEFGSQTSKIYVDKNKKYVLKMLIKHKEHDLIKREVHVLNLLNSNHIDWAPQLIYSKDEILVTKYSGERINENNIPSDYAAQGNKILQDLSGLRIKHNDLKRSEILVKDGKLYLCDFGWASINNDFSCGIDISKKPKIHGIFDDKKFIDTLDKIYKEKAKKIPVSQRRNKSGSQSEIPKITINEQGKSITVSGYQIYKISTENKSIKYLNRTAKYDLIRSILSHETFSDCNSLADVGCSSGIISYTANELGYNPVFAMDHDQEYLDIMNQINKALSIDSISVRKFSFGDVLPSVDVLIMGALIHWVYSCTALYGNFDKIFSYLRKSINKYLIIEWIDGQDASIKEFKHISHNEGIHTQEYNKENFEKSLIKNIGEISSVWPTTAPTRLLYIVKKRD